MQAGVTTGFGVVSDSTANDTLDWVYLFSTDLAARYSNYTVKHYLWSDASQTFSAPSTIQTGTSGARYATFTASSSTLTLADADVGNFTTDLDVCCHVALDDWTPAANNCLVAHFGGSPNRSFRFYIPANGKPILEWSNDGTTLVSGQATVAPTVSDGSGTWLRATLDVDNGAGGYDLKFYTSSDGATWTQLGTTVTGVGTTSVYNANAVWELGGRGSTTEVMSGKFYEVNIRDGIDGPMIAPALPDLWQGSATTRPTLSGAPVLSVVNGSNPGSGLSYLGDATRLPKLLSNYGQAVTFISVGHNEGYSTGKTEIDLYSTMVTNVKANLYLSAPVLMSQNPRISPAASISEHALRASQVMNMAAKTGVPYIDIYGAYVGSGIDLTTLINNSDGIHPIQPLGSQFWANVVMGEFDRSVVV